MRNRNCRKCGKYIPSRITVDGKIKNLQHRKFCLECSPFGCHNTKTDDPSREARKKSGYKNWSAEDKLLHTARVYRRGILRKEKLIEMAGGKCSKCGYSKCRRALTFHHRDPSTKLFGLGLNELWSRSWTKIEEEFQKCDLVCIRCHMEIEDETCPVNEKSYRAIIDKLFS